MLKRSYQINYILHLNRVSQMITEDKRLKSWHVSLYYALFHMWNAANFNNPIMINRSELAKAAKLGSFNTYHKGMHQLEEWKYIIYEPSHSQFVPSVVHMCIFDTTHYTTESITGDSTSTTTDKQQMSPSNKRNKITKKQEVKTKNTESKSSFDPPKLAEVLEFFKENNSVKREAELFFLHYEAVGWKSGKNDILNWKPLAKKWMLNAHTLPTSPSGKLSPNHLHAKLTNYEETL